MAISTNYPSPVQVNGYSCRNCTDVDYAKKGIDPAHPKSGPYGVNAATDPDRIAEAGRSGAVSLGGRLSDLNAGACSGAPTPRATGTQLDICV